MLHPNRPPHATDRDPKPTRALTRSGTADMLRFRFLAVVLLTTASIHAHAQVVGDAAAGKAYFEAECAECHRVAKLKGERASEFVAATQAIAAGKAKHRPKIKLTSKTVADMTAFLQPAS